MLRKGAFYVAGLIGLYIVVWNGSNAGKVFSAGAQGFATDVRALQGR